MELGARVLKTGVAVTLALYICALMELTPALIGAVAAILTMQPSIYRSWRHIRDQVRTNVLGAGLALLAGLFFSNEPIAIGMICIVVIMICLKLKMESTIGLTLVTVIAIMDVAGDASVHWSFAVNRFLIIMIGIGSAFLVNIAFFPPQHEKHFLKQVQSVFSRLSLLLRNSIFDKIKESVYKKQREEMLKALHKLEDIYEMFEEERKKLGKRGKRGKRTLNDARLLLVYKQMLRTLRKGLDLQETIGRYYVHLADSSMDERFDRQMEELIKHHELVQLKFEGKLKVEGTVPNRSEASSESFLQEMMKNRSLDEEQLSRVILVAATMYDYGCQITRLDRVVNHYMDKTKSAKPSREDKRSEIE
ncbi:aromatic acid exporter family protein [Paenibacillus sp. J2TS4]|uniref:FUSC family protein n=1 Tax=Paenibacillus sp. J2TS4 TaxID=2807194 RepID=UPI001B163D36|nr:aromatic acid exporter family protein [Paenibacillus sp. J2TS4]GIP34093.1 membrane protein [Paenibacillus sp. J2TS4]